jgi:hypothetical protein
MQQQLGIVPANGKWDANALQHLIAVHTLAQTNPALAATMLGQEAPLMQNALQRAASPDAQFSAGYRFNPTLGRLEYTAPSSALAAGAAAALYAQTGQFQGAMPQNLRPMMMPDGRIMMVAGGQTDDDGHPIHAMLDGLGGARIAGNHPEWAERIRGSKTFQAAQERYGKAYDAANERLAPWKDAANERLGPWKDAAQERLAPWKEANAKLLARFRRGAAPAAVDPNAGEIGAARDTIKNKFADYKAEELERLNKTGLAPDVAEKRAGRLAGERIDQELADFDGKPFVSKGDAIKNKFADYKAEELERLNKTGLAPDVAEARAGRLAGERIDQELANFHVNTAATTGKEVEGAARGLANAEKTGGRGALEAIGEAAAGSKVLKGIGKVAVPLAIAADVLDFGASVKADADRGDGSHIETKKAFGRIGGGWGGALAGAAIGQAVIPIPVVGAVIGGIAGGFLGSSAGEWFAKQL